MSKMWMLCAALLLGVSTPMIVSAQDAPEREAKEEAADGEDEKVEKPELPKSDEAAMKALKGAYTKMYSPRAKGMKKLWGKMKMVSNFKFKMGDQEMEMSDTVDYEFVWNGKDPVAVKDVTKEENPNPMARGMRQGLKQQADGMGKFIDMFIGTQSFSETFNLEETAFAFEEVSEEETKAKVQRIKVTSITEENTLKEEVYELKEGLLSSFPGDDAIGAMKVEWTKKGRDYFLKSAGFSAGNGAMAAEMGYTFSKIKKAGKYSMPTSITVATKMAGMADGTTKVTLSGFKVDKKVTVKMIDAIIKPKSAEGDKKDGDKKGDSPVEGLSKEEYDRIKKQIKSVTGREPTDEQIKAFAERMKGGNGGNGGGRRFPGGGRRGR